MSSIRNAIKAKFKSDKSQEKVEGESQHGKEMKEMSCPVSVPIQTLPPVHADLLEDEEEDEDLDLLQEKWKEDEEFVIRDDFDPLSLLGGIGASPPPRSPPVRRAQGSERAIFELQLTQLQEQLVTAMIDNQNISSELREFKEKHHVDKLLKDLEYEREKNQLFSERLAENVKRSQESPAENLGLRRRQVGDKQTETEDGSKGGSTSSGSGSGGGARERKELDSDWVDLAQEATEEIVLKAAEAAPSKPRTFLERVQEWFVSQVYEIVADFTEEAQPEPVEDVEGDPLTVKKLKENVKRFGNATTPIYRGIKGLDALVSWRSPALTLLVFCVYTYSVWHGWIVPVILFLILFRIFINYLRYRGWKVNIRYLHDEEENKEVDDNKDLGMSDKFNLVVQVARKAQNTLGKIADNLEKFKNLVEWREPEATRYLFLFLCGLFTASVLLPTQVFFTMCGLYFGVKMFIVNYVYSRFPRFQQRHDSTYRIWKTMPTDAQLEKRHAKAEIDKYVLPSAVEAELSSQITSPTSMLSEEDRSFCELFSLPLTECPLSGWQGGRRCTLINREKSLTAAFKNGRLYLTRSFLCFERAKTPSPKNLIIPLSDITRMEKAKPYSWLPGGGMSLEVTVAGVDKPYILGALLNRDECYESIMITGINAGLPWATLSEGNPSLPSTPATSRKSGSEPSPSPIHKALDDFVSFSQLKDEDSED